jgi:hypothetical protein
LNQASHIGDAALGKARELELRPLTVSALDPAVIRWWRWQHTVQRVSSASSPQQTAIITPQSPSA